MLKIRKYFKTGHFEYSREASIINWITKERITDLDKLNVFKFCIGCLVFRLKLIFANGQAASKMLLAEKVVKIGLKIILWLRCAVMHKECLRYSIKIKMLYSLCNMSG